MGGSKGGGGSNWSLQLPNTGGGQPSQGPSRPRGQEATGDSPSTPTQSSGGSMTPQAMQRIKEAAKWGAGGAAVGGLPGLLIGGAYGATRPPVARGGAGEFGILDPRPKPEPTLTRDSGKLRFSEKELSLLSDDDDDDLGGPTSADYDSFSF